MPPSQLTLYQADIQAISALCASLRAGTDAQAVILVDNNGQFIASDGDIAGFDTTSLASLTAGNMASTQGLAELIGEQAFDAVHHEGQNESLLLCALRGQAILIVMFDKRTTLGLVRLRSKKVVAALEEILQGAHNRHQSREHDAPLAQWTQEDIDNLFGR